MSRETILKLVKVNHDRLRKLSVRELGSFGSYARGDAPPDSDVDFFVDHEEKSFDRYMMLGMHGLLRIRSHFVSPCIVLSISALYPKVSTNTLVQSSNGRFGSTLDVSMNRRRAQSRFSGQSDS